MLHGVWLQDPGEERSLYSHEGNPIATYTTSSWKVNEFEYTQKRTYRVTKMLTMIFLTPSTLLFLALKNDSAISRQRSLT